MITTLVLLDEPSLPPPGSTSAPDVGPVVTFETSTDRAGVGRLVGGDEMVVTIGDRVVWTAGT